MLEDVSLVQKVYDVIKDRIVTGEYVPGRHLKDQHLSREFGISRSPIREALAKLERELWVEALPRRGSFVKRFTPSELLEMYDIREALEGIAARLAAPLVSEEELARMRQLIDSGMESIRAGDFEGSVDADTEFHSVIVKASRNRRLHEIITNCHLQARDYRSRKKPFIQDMERYHQEHVAIIEALAKHDPDLAEELVREHIHKAKVKAKSLMEKQEPDLAR